MKAISFLHPIKNKKISLQNTYTILPYNFWVTMSEDDITKLLQDVEAKHDRAFDRLLEKVYPALKEVAQARLRDQWVIGEWLARG